MMTINIWFKIYRDDLIRAIVRVYNNPDRNRVEVQYESLFTWLGRGSWKNRGRRDFRATYTLLKELDECHGTGI